MDSADNSFKAEMKHMEYEEDLSCSNKMYYVVVHHEIVIDQTKRRRSRDLQNALVLIFYVGYIVIEMASNILLRKFGAATWLSFLGVCWGRLTSSCFGIWFQ